MSRTASPAPSRPEGAPDSACRSTDNARRTTPPASPPDGSPEGRCEVLDSGQRQFVGVELKPGGVAVALHGGPQVDLAHALDAADWICPPSLPRALP